MRLNKKGMSMVEIIVSIVLISIVLIFLMTLFLKVRTTYNQSKIQADYDILVSNVIKAIGNDIENYGLKSVEYEKINEKENTDAVVLTFNTFRTTNLSENITKVLRVYFENNKFYISYSYEAKYTQNMTSTERVTNVVREIPDDVILDKDGYVKLEKLDDFVKLKVPMSDKNGNIYDINIYGIIG